MSKPEFNKDELARIVRNLIRDLDQRGVPEGEIGNIIMHQFRDDQERKKAWLVESLLFCARSLQLKQYPEAFRGLLQAHEYRGNKGFWPGPNISDYAGILKNMVEDKLR